MIDKVAKEVAEAEFDRFAEMMDLEVDPVDMDEEDKKGFVLQRNRVVAAIENGSLVINDDGEPVYTPRTTKDSEPLTFHEPTGASFMAMDRKKKSEDVGKMYAVMGDMTKTHASTFAKMKGRDLKVCQAIVTLFLG